MYKGMLFEGVQYMRHYIFSDLEEELTLTDVRCVWTIFTRACVCLYVWMQAMSEKGKLKAIIEDAMESKAKKKAKRS